MFRVCVWVWVWVNICGNTWIWIFYGVKCSKISRCDFYVYSKLSIIHGRGGGDNEKQLSLIYVTHPSTCFRPKETELNDENTFVNYSATYDINFRVVLWWIFQCLKTTNDFIFIKCIKLLEPTPIESYYVLYPNSRSMYFDTSVRCILRYC